MSNRKAIIAGKKERIRKLLHNIHATQPQPMVKEQPWLAEVLERDRSYHLTAGKESAFTGHPEVDSATGIILDQSTR